MPQTLPKYRVALKEKKAGLSVAAETPLAAIQMCFPDRDIKEVSHGYRWVQFKVTPPVELTWPNDKKPEGAKADTCAIVDVETLGEILVP